MNERTKLITAKGNPLTLLGNVVKTGDRAPAFNCLNGEMEPVESTAFANKIVVLASVPSLDTPVCDIEIRRFNAEAEKLGDDIAIVTISMDLPFAQKRWCGSAGMTRVTALSDHRNASFGMAYGVLIKELRLLARAVFVVDREGMIQHAQLVKELTDEPDYQAALDAVARLA